MKQKRVVLILLIVAILMFATVGIMWYLRRKSGSRPLIRARVAYQAGKYDKTIELAKVFVANRPDDWRGHHILAEAYLRLGKYEQACRAAQSAVDLRPTEAKALLVLAGSYYQPARRIISVKPGQRLPSAEKLNQAIKEFARVKEILMKAESSDKKDTLDVQQYRGLNNHAMSMALGLLSQRFNDDAKSDEARRDFDKARAKRKRSAAVLSKSQQAESAAIKSLLDVIKADPSRSQAANIVVDLCIRRRNASLLKELREAILPAEQPPVRAAAKILGYDLGLLSIERNLKIRKKRLKKIIQSLGDLLKKYPKNAEVKLTLASAALANEDYAETERICKKLIKEETRTARANLILARLRMKQKDYASVKRILFRLRSRRKGWPPVYILYARAAIATGEKISARKAMRDLTTYVPNHPVALKFLARSLMRDGYNHRAFTDAKAYYTAYDSDPSAVGLYVQTAWRTRQIKLAQDALKKAFSEHSDRAAMMLIVAEGYASLGQKDKAAEAMRRTTECKPRSMGERLAVARAMRMTGRISDAEKILDKELEQNPTNTSVHFELGQLYSATGRVFQAIEQYRLAVKGDENNVDYQLALAKVLFNSGNLEQCRSVLEKVDKGNADANLLRLQIKLMQGQDVDSGQMLQQLGGAKQAGRVLAMTYLRRGLPDKCIERCRSELKKTPNDSSLRFLMGQAYLVQGQRDKCLEQWYSVVRSKPASLPIYLRIAAVMAEKLQPEQVFHALTRIDGAKRDCVELAMGWLYMRGGYHGQAAGIYRSLAQRQDAPSFSRNRARILLAKVLASRGNIDHAVTELDKLASVKAWYRLAQETKVSILVASGRKEQANTALEALYKVARNDKDASAMRRIALAYLRTGQTEKALSVCDKIENLLPNDARTYLLRAIVFARAAKGDDVIEMLEKAIELQPGRLETYVKLARAMDSLQRPIKALAVLKRMENTGKAGQAMAIYERGRLFVRWGLNAQSIETCKELITKGYGEIPQLQFRLALAFAQLGQEAQASKLLQGIPVHARQYVMARQLLVDIAKTDREKLDILDKLEKDRPGELSTLVKKMNVLLRAKRTSDVIREYKTFKNRYAKNRSLNLKTQLLLLRAMLRSGDRASAVKFAAKNARGTHSAFWRQLAVLFSLDDDPKSAAGMLPPMEKAHLFDACLGLILAVRDNNSNATQLWMDRIDDIYRTLAKMPNARSINPHYRLLSYLLAGRTKQAEAALKKTTSTDVVSLVVANEEILHASKSQENRREAASLIKTMMAIDLSMGEFSGSWVMEILKKRPRCQWAAALVIRNRPDTETYKKVLDILRPKDCILAQMVRADMLLKEKKYKKAADVYKQITGVEKNNPYLILTRANAAERAGRFDEALSLYRKVYQMTSNPIAANSAAYLISLLHPKDTQKLNEAMVLVDKAVKAIPRSGAFRDTKGWICFLLGKSDQALQELRRAVKAMPQSAEVHYHLGMAESTAGNMQMARWHLQASVSSVESARIRGGKSPATETKAAERAKKILAVMTKDKQ